MKILHELNQMDKGGAERVVLGIIRHDKTNTHQVYTYKDGPMRELFEKAGATVLIEPPAGEPSLDIDCDLVHLHTGGDVSHLANSVKGELVTVETIHTPVVTAVRDEWVRTRIGVSNVVTKKNRKCITIHNGIDIDRLEVDREGPTLREKLGIPEHAFVIGRLGRLGLDKCVEEFLVACKQLQQRNLEKEIHILIVGDEARNANTYLAKLKTMAYSLPLKNYHFHPAVEEVGWAFRAMDLFLYPSPTEAFGLVYLEAMACGVPVVAWENEVTKELLFGGALLVENNVQGLVKGAEVVMRNDLVRAALIEEGQKLALNDFTEERMSEKYQELYASLEQLAMAPVGA